MSNGRWLKIGLILLVLGFVSCAGPADEPRYEDSYRVIEDDRPSNKDVEPPPDPGWDQKDGLLFAWTAGGTKEIKKRGRPDDVRLLILAEAAIGEDGMRCLVRFQEATGIKSHTMVRESGDARQITLTMFPEDLELKKPSADTPMAHLRINRETYLIEYLAVRARP